MPEFLRHVQNILWQKSSGTPRNPVLPFFINLSELIVYEFLCFLLLLLLLMLLWFVHQPVSLHYIVAIMAINFLHVHGSIHRMWIWPVPFRLRRLRSLCLVSISISCPPRARLKTSLVPRPHPRVGVWGRDYSETRSMLCCTQQSRPQVWSGDETSTQRVAAGDRNKIY